jgi:hypothetical protein
MNQNRSYLRSIIIAAIVMIGTISAAYAAPIDIAVSGQVVYEDSSVCNNPTVSIANMATGGMGIVETNESSNYYLATLNVSVNDTLQFTATSPDESQSSVTEYVITQNEIDAGSFVYDITLAGPGDITPPEITSVLLNPVEVEAEGAIIVTVTATDDSGIASVTAEGVELLLVANDTYEGTIVAASAPGVYNVLVVATDDSANSNSATDNLTTYTVLEDPGDITPPEITSVLLDPEVTLSNGPITVTVTVTDDSGIASVTADIMKLVLVANDTYEGVIYAASAPGVYNVIVVATDASDNNNMATFDSATYEVRPPVTLSIEDVTLRQGWSESVPIMVFDVVDMGGCEVNFVYDPTVVCMTEVTRGDMNFSFEYNINNGSGWMRANALDVNGVSGDVVFAYVTLTAVGNKSDTSEMVFEDSQLVDASFGEITHVIDNGLFSIVSNVRPVVTNVSATLDTILYDNGRPRAPGTNISLLNAYVTDEDGNITEVTIDLSSIGGSPVQPMEHVAGDMWAMITNATEVAVNIPDFVNQLTITATDNDGGISDPVNLELTVLKRGDVNGDGYVNKMDADYISRYLAGLEPEVLTLVGDVVGEAGDPVGDGIVDLMDALYIAKYTEGMVEEP